MVFALCAGALPHPPPPPGGCSCFAVSGVLLCGAAVCCGLFCVVRGVVRCSSVPCGVLSCCIVGLALAVSRGRCVPFFALMSCGALLCGAFLCGVLSWVLPSRVVVWCVVVCVVLVSGVVLSLGLPRCVGFSFLSPPPLLPPVAVTWSPVVARCCVLSWGAVLCWSVVPHAVWCVAVRVVSCWCCPVASFALAGAVCCYLWLLDVRCWVWLPAVVFHWRALVRVLMPGRVACCPAVCFGLLWRPAPLCCVLCSVALCCRVVPCCGALLSVFFCYVVGVVSVALCCPLAPPVVHCALLLRVVFCAAVVSPCALLCCRLGAVLCLVSLPLFVGGSGCLVWFSGGACLPRCPFLASGRPPCCLVCWCGVPWCSAPCAVSCVAVRPCGAVLSGCVVRLSTLLNLFFLASSTPLQKSPAVSLHL